MSHTFSSTFIHLVWTTKKRIPMILPDRSDGLYQYIRDLARRLEFPVIAIGGIADHIHVLIKAPHDYTLSNFVRVIKNNSSKMMRQAYPECYFTWQVGYSQFSISSWDVLKIKMYIEKQVVHHKNYTIEQELELLMEKHTIKFDTSP